MCQLALLGRIVCILVSRGRTPSGQYQGSRPLAGSNTGSLRVVHRNFIKSGKSDWLKMQNDYSAHALKIGSGQRFRFLVLTNVSRPLGMKMNCMWLEPLLSVCSVGVSSRSCASSPVLHKNCNFSLVPHVMRFLWF